MYDCTAGMLHMYSWNATLHLKDKQMEKRCFNYC